MDVCKLWRVRTPIRQSLQYTITLFLALFACPFFLPAQESQAPDPIVPSGLAVENLSRVAASTAQIEDLLRKEPGLLVELKRWVAKEATDRGQILDDAELTDQAIFERLSRELEFRSRATRLLQRYGYLMPKLNPDSEAAREHEILVSERNRRLARAAGEEDQAPAEKNPQTELKRSKECDGLECAQSAQPQVPQQTRDNYLEKPEVPNRPRVQTISLITSRFTRKGTIHRALFAVALPLCTFLGLLHISVTQRKTQHCIRGFPGTPISRSAWVSSARLRVPLCQYGLQAAIPRFSGISLTKTRIGIESPDK